VRSGLDGDCRQVVPVPASVAEHTLGSCSATDGLQELMGEGVGWTGEPYRSRRHHRQIHALGDGHKATIDQLSRPDSRGTQARDKGGPGTAPSGGARDRRPRSALRDCPNVRWQMRGCQCLRAYLLGRSRLRCTSRGRASPRAVGRGQPHLEIRDYSGRRLCGIRGGRGSRSRPDRSNVRSDTAFERAFVVVFHAPQRFLKRERAHMERRAGQ
jgi:hypothetical protein